MKKLDNFTKCLNKLQTADFTKDDEFYKAGVITHFTLTFELAWKALQATLRFHGVVEAETGSPREILKLGYKFGYIDNDDVWLTMLRKRNAMSHIYHRLKTIAPYMPHLADGPCQRHSQDLFGNCD